MDNVQECINIEVIEEEVEVKVEEGEEEEVEEEIVEDEVVEEDEDDEKENDYDDDEVDDEEDADGLDYEEAYSHDVPFPYDEDADPDKFWFPDLFDNALPKQKGLITDIVYFMRGMEVPTLFTVWSTLWLLSTIVKREAWIKWYPRDLYANLFVLLAGPAGSKKSTTIDDVGVPMVEMMRRYIENGNIRNMKKINIVKDKMTPEALLDAMLPGTKQGSSFIFRDEEGNAMLDKRGRPLRYKPTSEVGIVLSEMSSSIGKKNYTEGFTEILLDLYNPKDSWEWRTRGQGVKRLQRTYVTMLAATTPTAFKESIPKVAAGDGFLSRCVIVYQSGTNRRFSMPRPVLNGPTLEELAKRAAWVCENGLGEYKLTNDAFALYDEWYLKHKNYLEANASEGGIRGRMDINLLKVALLIRIQRYSIEPIGLITIEDVKDAIKLLDLTYGMSIELLGEMTSDIAKAAKTVERILEKEIALYRPDLMRRSKLLVEEFNKVLEYLSQTGVITIIVDGKEKKFPSKSTKEKYVLNSKIEEAMHEQEEEWNDRKERSAGHRGKRRSEKAGS